MKNKKSVDSSRLSVNYDGALSKPSALLTDDLYPFPNHPFRRRRSIPKEKRGKDAGDGGKRD